MQIISFITIFIILAIVISGIIMKKETTNVDFSSKNLTPSLNNPFGTDWMGRDMFMRVLVGLSTSIMIGLIASLVSSLMALIIGAIAGSAPKWIDNIINWIIDLFMGIPHILLLIIISFVVGRGFKGILIGIALTHWTSLARLIRSEVLQIKNESYIKLSRKLGKSKFYILKKHIIPIVFPQFIVGLILLFPHAILHEASVTFLGFGMPPEQPAIGIILSESMKYLSSGMWWLAFFPGLSLVLIVLLFEKLGDNLRRILDPYSAQE